MRKQGGGCRNKPNILVGTPDNSNEEGDISSFLELMQ